MSLYERMTKKQKEKSDESSDWSYNKKRKYRHKKKR